VTTLAPASVGAASAASIYWAGAGTLGSEIVGSVVAARLAAVTGAICIALTPAFAAVLQAATLNLISANESVADDGT
jgi:hypothetical protein